MNFSQWLGGLLTDATFWTAVQGIGTVVAAVAAAWALWLAWHQLHGLTESNRLLAESNDEMSESNVALVRPYVQVDFKLVPMVKRDGGVEKASIYVEVVNIGKTVARNVRLKVDAPFHPNGEIPEKERGWRNAVDELNRIMSGDVTIPTLSPSRTLDYYLADNKTFLGKDDEALPTWTVAAEYEDSAGRVFKEDSVLNLEAWKMSIMSAPPAVRSVKTLERIAVAVEGLKP